ncbi:MAG TPA: DUF4386 domain-containing protein [Candidatus Eisenbacteria bacterium]|nr:DUF4386 domain-containing protein [Candidatus Eisenbacteria bacterium]
MVTRNATARRAGVLYFLFMIVAIVGEFLMPAFTVPGDAAATARNITTSEFMYRIDILLGFGTLVLFLFLVVNLYQLLRDADRGQAMLMVVLVSVGVAVALANTLLRLAPLVLLNGTDYLSAFTGPQREALALGFLRLHGAGAAISMGFWGLWLFPFGILVLRSGFLPRVLGVLLMIAGSAYLVSSVTTLAMPAYKAAVTRVMMPLYFGEVPIIFWLMLKGAKVPQAALGATGAHPC